MKNYLKKVKEHIKIQSKKKTKTTKKNWKLQDQPGFLLLYIQYIAVIKNCSVLLSYFVLSFTPTNKLFSTTKLTKRDDGNAILNISSKTALAIFSAFNGPISSAYCSSFMAYITSYYGKQNHIKPLNAEQVAEDVFFICI